MASEARKKSWLAHDAKRKDDAQRRRTERARGHARRLPKTGRCELCGDTGDTVWHHPDYRYPKDVIELCHVCHRGCHPRKLPQGGIA
jgi:hypothetical protein